MFPGRDYQGISTRPLIRYTVTYEAAWKYTVREGQERAEGTIPLYCLWFFATSIPGGQDIRFEGSEVTATAYCPCAKCCGPSNVGKTAGIPYKGVMRDPRVIPLGTRVYVDGYGEAIAADVGSAIKGNRIDVCFDTHEEAWSWGVKRTKVYILSQ